MQSPVSSLLRYAFVGATLLFGALVFFSPLLRAAEQLYTCGMHPQIIKKEPGNCPICGMKLTPVRDNSAAGGVAAPSGERKIKFYKSTMMPGEVSPKPGKDSMGMDLVPVYDDGASAAPGIQIDAATVQRMNLKTDIVARGPVRREIRNVGTVAYDESGLRDITTKYEGWIEKLFVNTIWATVKAGDPLFEIYSPDLYNAQLNYLVARRSEGEAGGALTRAALARLQLFDVPADFIAEVARAGEARRTYVFRAPAAGVVIEKMAVAGQMMKPGERIYRLADLSSVWVLAQIFEQDLPFVRVGQETTVRVTYGPERKLAGTVQLLLPQVEEQTRTATARIVLSNPDGFLRPGMFVDVRLAAQLSDSAVLVPEMAVLRSGERNTVFVAKDGGTFEPREVKLGSRSQDGRYEVLDGLAAGERIVTSGQFMLDSESQLREAIQKMLKSSETAPAVKAEGSRAGLRPAQEGGSETRPTPDATAALKPLAFALADAAAALAADDLPGYQKQLPALRAALAAYLKGDPHGAHGPLAKFTGALSDRADLKAARRDFAPLSTAVADLARANHLHHTAGLHLFECTMAPVVVTGRWLQRGAGVKNPFYGSTMLECGEELDAPAAPAAPAKAPEGPGGGMATLPPGHPPIPGVSVAEYLLSQPSANMPGKNSSDGACGNCGMSAAAMAAGEPCEHDKPTKAGSAVPQAPAVPAPLPDGHQHRG